MSFCCTIHVPDIDFYLCFMVFFCLSLFAASLLFASGILVVVYELNDGFGVVYYLLLILLSCLNGDTAYVAARFVFLLGV